MMGNKIKSTKVDFSMLMFMYYQLSSKYCVK